MKMVLVLLLSVLSCTAYSNCENEPYSISMEIIEKDNGEPYLVIHIDLAEGSHFVSPYSNDTFSGRFDVQLEDGNMVSLGETFVESPRSVEVFDPHPFVKGYVNWVRTDTKYEYPLIINGSADFGVVGEIRFVIEPKCTMERIPFIIKRVDGKLVAGRDMC